MGDYTPNQKFYLTDPEELVNVEQDLNYNIRLADTRVRPLVEYQWTDLASITQSDLPKDTGFKWYKSYTNSVWVRASDGLIYQDVNSQIDTWSTGFTWASGYGPANTNVDNVAVTMQNGMVRLRGQVVLNGGSTDLPLNTNTNVFELPVQFKPVDPCYITLYGGNASSGDFQTFRFFVPGASAGSQFCQFIKYGGSGSSSSERFLSLNGVYFTVDN